MKNSFTEVSTGVGTKAPSHSVKLTAVNGDTLGLILCDRSGKVDNRALSISSMPRTALQMSQANVGYDDMELPFTTEIQNSWIGGRGQDSFSSDRTKYYDGYRIDTSREYPICAPLETVQTGIGTADLDQDVESFYDYYFTAGTTSPYYNFRVKVVNTGTLAGISLSVHFVGDETAPATNQITFDYAVDVTAIGADASLPSELTFTTLTLDADDYDETATWWEIVIPINSAVVAGQAVNLIIGDFSHDIDIRYSVTGGWGFLTEDSEYIFSSEDDLMIITGDDPDDKIQSSAADGIAWTTTSEFGSIFGSLLYGGNTYARFFEYKNALYAVINDSNDSGTPRLFINGYRGAALSNGGNLALTKTGLTITEDLTGKIVLITAGRGSTETQPWRKIKSNSGGVLTVTPSWFTAEDTTTEFVIIGCDTWTEITGHGLTKPITDIAVINDYVVFAQGADTKMRCMQSYNSTGTWTTHYCEQNYYADFLEQGVLDDGTPVLWKAVAATSLVTRSRIGTWATATAAPTLFTFDVNYERRNDLKLMQDRLYASLWEDVTNSNNDNLLTLTRTRDNLKVEATRLVGTGTAASPQADTYLAEANTRFTLATENKLAALRMTEDLKLEAFRIIGDGTIATPTTYTDYRATVDSLLKTSLASGTAGEQLDLQNRVYQIIGNGTLADQSTAVVELQTGTAYSLLRKALADSTTADAIYLIADSEVNETKDRAIDILGATGTVASPGEISAGIAGELSRVLTDITAENARVLRTAGAASDMMRQILDLQYQIVETATESENNGTAAITTPSLAAHTDLVIPVAHKYLKDSIVCGNGASKITGMVMYSEPQIPYIFKEDSLGSIRDNIYAEIPIPALRQVRSELNGKVSMQHGVYLYFSMAGGMIERYYDQKLDDVGVTRGEGMPRNRQGEIGKMLPYPGRFYASINAGFSGDSSIVCFNEIGWHEIYRASTIGKSITDLHVQTIPGFDNSDRMFFAEGSSIKSIPIAINPLKQYDYKYFGYGIAMNELPYIETSWIDFGLKDVNKYFNSVTIFSDCTDTSRPKGTEYSIYVHYMADNDRYWTLAGKGGAYAAQEIELDKLHRLAGKRIKLKISMCSNTEAGETPRLKAVVVNGVLRMPVKRSYSITFMLEPMKDLQDKPLTDNPAAIYDKLHFWSNSKTQATPLTMNTNDAITDGKVVFIDPASIATVQAMSQMGEGSGQKSYIHVGTMQLYEV